MARFCRGGRIGRVSGGAAGRPQGVGQWDNTCNRSAQSCRSFASLIRSTTSRSPVTAWPRLWRSRMPSRIAGTASRSIEPGWKPTRRSPCCSVQIRSSIRSITCCPAFRSLIICSVLGSGEGPHGRPRGGSVAPAVAVVVSVRGGGGGGFVVVLISPTQDGADGRGDLLAGPLDDTRGEVGRDPEADQALPEVWALAALLALLCPRAKLPARPGEPVRLEPRRSVGADLRIVLAVRGLARRRRRGTTRLPDP